MHCNALAKNKIKTILKTWERKPVTCSRCFRCWRGLLRFLLHPDRAQEDWQSVASRPFLFSSPATLPFGSLPVHFLTTQRSHTVFFCASSAGSRTVWGTSLPIPPPQGKLPPFPSPPVIPSPHTGPAPAVARPGLTGLSSPSCGHGWRSCRRSCWTTCTPSPWRLCRTSSSASASSSRPPCK